MLPGLRQLLLAILATVVVTALGLGQLARYEVAQTHSAKLPPQDVRFAGLAFAARADWTPEHRIQRVSLETLAPFNRPPIKVPPPVPARMVPESGIETVFASLAAAPTVDLAHRPTGAPEAIAPRIATSIAIPPTAPDRPADTISVERIVYAALPVAATDLAAIRTETADTEAASLAAESVRIVVREPERPIVPAAPAIAPAAATVIATIATIPLSEVKLPVPRPRLAKVSPPGAKPTAAKPQAKVRAPRPKRQARRAPKPAAPKPNNPFADLFAAPTPATGPSR